MSSTKLHPDRLYDALQSEWNERESVGVIIPPELEEVIRRYLRYACAMSAESVIHMIIRGLELTPHVPRGTIQYNRVMEMVRNTLPENSDGYLKITPREYKINFEPEVIEEPKTEKYEKTNG